MCPSLMTGTRRRRWTTRRTSSTGCRRTAARTRNFSASAGTASRCMVANKDVRDDRNKRAFLMTPREEFVLQAEPAARLRQRLPRHRLRRHHLRPAPRRPHDQHASTCRRARRCSRSAPARATSRPISSNLTDKVWSIEIIKPLAERTRGIYDALIAEGYTEYKAITTKNADGYYGWEEAGAVRQDHRHLRHRPHPAAAAAAAEAQRHHGHPGRPARARSTC